MEDILHVFGVNWKLLGIQMLNFAVLLFLLQRYLYKPLFRIVEEREKKIKKSIEDADALDKERKALKQESESILRGARSEGDTMIKEFRVRAEEEKKSILQKAEERAEKVVLEAEQVGERRKSEIVRESKDELARSAVKAVEEYLRKRQT